MSSSSTGLGAIVTPSGSGARGLAGQAPPEHVLEALQAVPAPGEQADDGGIAEARDLRLYRHAPLREGPLDRGEAVFVERPLEAEARDLVEGRARLGERGDAPGERRREDARVGVPPRGRRGAVGEQAALGPLDAGGEGRAGEEHGGFATS